MLFRCLITCLVSLALPVFAQGLTSRECAEIRAIYGVVPLECNGGIPGAPVPIAPAPIPQLPSYSNVPSGTPTYPNIAPVGLSDPTPEMYQNNVFFRRGGTELDRTALAQMDRLAELLNRPDMVGACVKLVGHSDSGGSHQVNREIGAKRAAVVRNRLALLIGNPNRIEVIESMGEESPLAGLPPESTWQRRVEIWARDCPTAPVHQGLPYQPYQ